MMADTYDNMSGGNTRARHYFIVINNFSEIDENNVKKESWKYTYQIEKGDNTGTLHLSGVISFKNARYFKSLKKLWPTAHLEKCKSLKAAINYNCKLETRVRGPYSTHKVILKDYFEYSKIKPFQREILDLLKTEPVYRKIHWYWDSKGGIGKTILCRHICMNDPNALYICGRAQDIKLGIKGYLDNGKNPSVILFDIARSQNLSYSGLEQALNGIAYSTKYESEMIIWNYCHVIVFSNQEPFIEKCSEDRWVIKEVGSDD